MLAALYFLLFIFLVLICGAVLAFPLSQLLQTVTDMEFHKLVGRSTILCALFFSFIYLKVNGISIKTGFGFAISRDEFIRQMLQGILVGISIIIVLIISLSVIGVYEVENDLDLSAGNLIKIFFIAIITGLLVGIVEESIFRGALFSALLKKTNVLTTVTLTSLVYAAVHFLKYREIADNVNITFLTGIEMIPAALFRFQDPAIIDSFITLFALGVLLSIIRLRHGNIAAVAGIHAGIVMMIKLAGDFTDYAAGNAYPFLVNKYDHMLGILAFVWLVIIIACYSIAIKRAGPA